MRQVQISERRVTGLSLPSVGDRGQRYEVWGRLFEKERQLGWVQQTEQITMLLSILPTQPSVVRTIDRERIAITCSTCNMTSYHPEDIANRFCGSCKTFLTDPAPGEPGSIRIAHQDS